DLLRRHREPVAAFSAALALDEARVLEVEQDVLEEFERDLLRLRDPVALDRAVAGGGELRAGAQGVVDLRRDAHGRIVLDPRAARPWPWPRLRAAGPRPPRGSCRSASPRKGPRRPRRPAARGARACP